ncbi:Arc-like DNA binding domain protein [Anaerotignum neopropionicum]|uniref:Arc-like DNA binding domain protein n=1 Tax=Anaerotignum neopropionicum TaxID=36847 RepID=A0A136WGN8_9FIRM|nr:Arc family DNA-binding protein [Anaerotignum neopropionicum]KXL53682.1 Arc-like DNA binding domain protein [Anaerotignum neopropionicum]
MNVKGVTIRFPQEMLDKIAYVADYEGRSVNSHVLVLVRQNIADFEKIHGKIEGAIAPDVNVKPPRKN